MQLVPVFDQGHLAFLSDVSELSFIGHDPTSDEAVSLGEEKELAAGFRSAFPDLHCSVQDVVAEGNKAVCRWRMSGTHQGSFFGIRPTGRGVSFDGITEMRLHGERLAEEWTQYDLLGFLSQLGVLPKLREVASEWPSVGGEDLTVGT